MRKSITCRNAELNTLAPLLNRGFLRIYTGPQPASPESAPAGDLLAVLRFQSPAFGPASGGIIAAAPMDEAEAIATGRAGWFRAFRADGESPVYDGVCGITGAEMNMPTTSIVAMATIAVTSLTITSPM